jgi:hypothetical protein
LRVIVGPLRCVGSADGRELATCTSLFMVCDHLRPCPFGKLDAFSLAWVDLFALQVLSYRSGVNVGQCGQNVRALQIRQLERHALKDRSAQNEKLTI